jgi:MYXO-CTERM domain-containing protein
MPPKPLLPDEPRPQFPAPAVPPVGALLEPPVGVPPVPSRYGTTADIGAVYVFWTRADDVCPEPPAAMPCDPPLPDPDTDGGTDGGAGCDTPACESPPLEQREAGCSCRAPGGTAVSPPPSAAWFALLAAMLIRRRRKTS